MKHIVWSLAFAAGLAWGSAGAQQAPAAPDAAAPAAAAPAAPAAIGGIQSQNIFQVKPDASADPRYAEQTNGERMKVQPGNNAPMWRQGGRA
jgi:formate dehydrogenase subunit gamma